MRLLQSMIIGALMLSTIGAAMAQPASAPLAPATGNPAAPVPLDVAVRALIEMCADNAGNAQTSFSDDQINSLYSLGFELTSGDGAHVVRVLTTAGGMVGTLHERGTCMIISGPIDRATFAAAFSAAFDSSDRYVRDSRPTPPNGSAVGRWRGQRVDAVIHQQTPGAPVTVRISRALDVRASR